MRSLEQLGHETSSEIRLEEGCGGAFFPDCRPQIGDFANDDRDSRKSAESGPYRVTRKTSKERGGRGAGRGAGGRGCARKSMKRARFICLLFKI